MKKLIIAILLSISFFADAQVKIGNNPGTINSNSLLEMESTDKGFLPPRVTLTSLSSVSPLTGTVPAGMLVYNSAGSLSYGFYYWDGTEWKKVNNGNKELVSKTADASLLKSENYIVASNDLTITLPAVVVADNGLEITVKNVGTHTDLVVVKGNGAATIDGSDSSNITKNIALSFVAMGGNWIVNGARKPNLHLMEVDDKSSWTTIEEAIEFLDEHMVGPTVIKLADESYEITETIVIDLPHSLTIQGNSYGSANIEAGTGLTGKPMFRCLSDAYFKMLNFDATTLTNYGDLTGEDAIRFVGSGTYNEVKDASFYGFNTTILDSTDAEIWIFEVDIANAKANGILIHSAVKYTSVKVAETDFINCAVGVRLQKGDSATIQLASGVYYGAGGTDTAIIYEPTFFTNPESISITGNSWNNVGAYITGFDFARSDSRDANFKVETNAGTGDNIPYCFINKLNATTGVSVTSGVWTKANWGSSDQEVISKWTVTSNKITYQPTNSRNGIFAVSGNIKVNSSSKNIQIAIVKNGNSTVRYGETTLRTVTSNQPYQYSFIAFLQNIQKDDYFEIWYTVNGNQTLTIEDLQWLVTAQ